LKKFTTLRTDSIKYNQPAFKIEPTSGSIEPGASQIFEATFAPEEVDDFSGLFLCKVFYAEKEIELPMSGLSRRPLVHFSISTSDYLSRRYPDYKMTLPSGTRAIEIIAKGINTRTVKKIEILNPTSDAYQVKWHRVENEEWKDRSAETNVL